MSRKKIDFKARKGLPVIAKNGLMTPKQRKSINEWLCDANLRVIENKDLFEKIGLTRAKFYSRTTKAINVAEEQNLETPEAVGDFTLNEIDVLLTIYNEDIKIKEDAVSKGKPDGTKDKMTDKERELMDKEQRSLMEE